MIDNADSLPVSRKCELMHVSRSTAYYQPTAVTEESLAIVEAIDEIYMRLLYLESRRIVGELEKIGLFLNRKRVQRLMGLMGITALYQKPRTSRPGFGKPESFNTDRGSQFTSTALSSVLEGNGVRTSMESKGSWIDNVFVERF